MKLIDNCFLHEKILLPVHQPYTPVNDLSIIIGLLKQYKITSFLEIGTCEGHTSFTIHKNLPDLKITTIDTPYMVNLHPHQTKEFLGTKERKLLKNTSINMIFGDSSSFKFEEKFEAVFIDGNHTADGVISDFKNIIKFLDNPKLVIFHDIGNSKLDYTVDAAISYIEKEFNITVSHVKESFIGFVLL